MKAEWVMVIITTIYVIATIAICFSNFQSAKMAQKANEINMILSILDTEKNRLFEIKKALDEFEQSATLRHQVINTSENGIEQHVKIQDSFTSLLRSLLLENDVNSPEYQKVLYCANCLYNNALELNEWFNKEYKENENDSFPENLEKSRRIQQEFCLTKENYILYRERKLSEHFNCKKLEEIQKYYCTVDFDRKIVLAKTQK